MSDVEYDRRVATADGRVGVQRVRRRGGWFSPSRVIAFLVGVVLVLVGAVAVARTGVDSTLNLPLTSVLGITQSASVGLAELVIGLLLIGCSAAEDLRGVIGLLGGLGLVAGIVGLAATAEIQASVGFARDTAWLFVVWGAIVLGGAFLPSSYRARSVVDTVD